MVARNPHEQGGLASPPPQLDDDEPADEPTDEPSNEPADEPADEQDGGGVADDDSVDDAGPRRRPGRASRIGSDGAGWVLGLVLWAGVVLPFLQGGPDGVRAWWLAKFLNRAPDGSELP